MDRKDFLRQMLCGGLGMCCCAAALGRLGGAQAGEAASQGNPDAPDWIPGLERRMIMGAESPPWRRLDKAVEWIRDLMTNMDAMLDQQTRIALMQACGRACYNRAFGVASEVKATPEAAERYLRALEAGGYKVERNPDSILVQFSWGTNHQNPQGLIIQDGYCMCPIVEPIIKDLSPTYCLCSSGYVREIFERSLGKSVKVEILETLQMGGSDCKFRIEIPSTA